MFILVFLLHTGEKPFKCICVLLFLHIKLILKPKFIFLNMYHYAKKPQFSESNAKLTVNQSESQYFGSKLATKRYRHIIISIVNNIK